MIMKTFFKSALRGIRQNTARLISVIAIIFLGISFVSGLGTLSPTILHTFDEELKKHNFSDIIVKSTDENGFSKEEVSYFQALENVTESQAMTVLDFGDANSPNTRIYILPEDGCTINALKILQGSLPLQEGQIAVEQGSDAIPEQKLGDSLEIFGQSFTIGAIVANPLIFTRDGEPDTVDQKPLEQIVYIDRTALPSLQFFPLTDVWLTLTETRSLNIFADEYTEVVQKFVEDLQKEFGDTYAYLTLEQNKSVQMLVSYCDKVSVITLVFPIFFIAVAALVVLTTMSRMIEEERSQIACFKTLGISDGAIICKYLAISTACCIAAAAAGMAIGLTLLPTVIYPAFNTIFIMPGMSGYIQPLAGLIAFFAMLLAVNLITFYVIRKELNSTPAALLLPRAPKAGKKIFLEKLPFFWNRLSFRYKSTFRNIFRRLNHLLMTVLTVAGSTALVFAGFSLFNVSKSESVASFGGMGESLSLISIMIIIFALLLCVFVIYNLTNMNIGERTRELATLKVLGYRFKEVLSYIYREIFIMAFFGVVVGLGLGCLLVYFVLSYLDFGSLADVQWYAYLGSAALIFVFIGLVDLILAPKIRSVDMTSSLKSVD